MFVVQGSLSGKQSMLTTPYCLQISFFNSVFSLELYNNTVKKGEQI